MKLWVFFILFTSSAPLAPGSRFDCFVVWNVGQGLWTTTRHGNQCLHIDAGGEHWPLRAVTSLCRGMKNQVLLSHGDLDHIGGLKSLPKITRNLCLAAAPLEPDLPERKRSLYADLPRCLQAPEVDEVSWHQRKNSANDFSRVFILQNKILLPGDSPGGEEKVWSHNIKSAANIQLLILGHHGSRTSTTEALLRQIPKLKMAIASARFQKYGHPHDEVVQRLAEHHVALLSTEDWGHLIFEL